MVALGDRSREMPHDCIRVRDDGDGVSILRVVRLRDEADPEGTISLDRPRDTSRLLPEVSVPDGDVVRAVRRGGKVLKNPAPKGEWF
jgi:hypothetical protein